MTNEAVEKPEVQELRKLDRNALRSKLLSTHKPKSEFLTIWDVEVELRQPTLDAILSARDTESIKERTVDMIIQYAYVPDTDERIFEPADRDQILRWPFGEEMVGVQKAITRLTGVDIGSAEEEVKKTPLEG